MRDEKIGKRILITALVCVAVLVIFFVQGAVVVIGQIEGAASALIRGAILMGGALLTILVYAIKNKSLKELGFVKMEKGAAKKLLYFSPLIVIALSHFSAGFDEKLNANLLLANLFLTVSIGLIEELYFRSIIMSLWLDKGIARAMLISAGLFGLCHIMNMAGGASLPATLLQICFALIYGLVFALLYAAEKSLIPLVLLHFFHDFCSFISAEGNLTFSIVLGAVQFLLLSGYFAYLLLNKVYNKEKGE